MAEIQWLIDRMKAISRRIHFEITYLQRRQGTGIKVDAAISPPSSLYHHWHTRKSLAKTIQADTFQANSRQRRSISNVLIFYKLPNLMAAIGISHGRKVMTFSLGFLYLVLIVRMESVVVNCDWLLQKSFQFLINHENFKVS